MRRPRVVVDVELESLLRDCNFAFVVASARLPDQPIVFASQSFYELTGYGPTEVLGRNCRFLQGRETSKRKVTEIRDAVREDRACQVLLRNYRRDGSGFWNLLRVTPTFDAHGCVEFFVGVQCDVSAAVEAAAGASRGSAELEPRMSDELQRGVDAIEQALRATQLGSHVHLAAPGNGGAAAHLVPLPACESLPASLLAPLSAIQQSLVLSDPNLPDCPIVYASSAFLELTGYSQEEVLHRNCRFLQSPPAGIAPPPGTPPPDEEQVAAIRDALRAEPPHPVSVTLLNFRKDGTPFWNSLHVAPIRSACGRVIFFAGVQLDVTEAAPSATAGAAAAAAAAAPGGAAGQGAQADGCAAQPGARGSGDAAAASEASGARAAAAAAECFTRRASAELAARARPAHMGAVGAVRVAVRSLGPGLAEGLRRSTEYQKPLGSPPQPQRTRVAPAARPA